MVMKVNGPGWVRPVRALCAEAGISHGYFVAYLAGYMSKKAACAHLKVWNRMDPQSSLVRVYVVNM